MELARYTWWEEAYTVEGWQPVGADGVKLL